jgi:hypothetical protein
MVDFPDSSEGQLTKESLRTSLHNSLLPEQGGSLQEEESKW